MRSSAIRRRVVGALLALCALGVWGPQGNAEARDGCVPAEECCKVCSHGKACGNSCIRADYQCHKGRGCACDEEDVCE